MKDLSIVVAISRPEMGIGKNGSIPWKLKKDIQFFKEITSFCPTAGKRNAVIMGKNTWFSIPEKFRPLSNRLNIVVSSTMSSEGLSDDVVVLNSFSKAIEHANMDTSIMKVFVIGGERLYKEAIESCYCSKLYVTQVLQSFPDVDAHFPQISALDYRLSSCGPIQNEDGIQYRFTEFERIVLDDCEDINPEESQYLSLIRNILDFGVIRGDRTGTGTISKFGAQMRFSLRNGRFPLLTTKRVFWRGVAEELLWFIQGCTNANTLSEKGVHIWDGNGSREFLDKLGLTDREVGDLGPVYGFQWRHFGAKYHDMHWNYEGQGIDQLNDCIHKIKTNPEDRRLIMTAWNPSDLSLMALPPCHLMCQFYVANGELSCQMYQRSADMGLGVPFNIASYALLTLLVAQVCNLKPGDFVHTIGDAHVYLNHIDALKEQLERKPMAFPTISINPDVTEIDKFKFDDFKIHDYNPAAVIKMKMAV